MMVNSMKCFEIVSTGIRFSNDIEKIKLIKIKIMRKKGDGFIPEDVYLFSRDHDYPNPMLDEFHSTVCELWTFLCCYCCIFSVYIGEDDNAILFRLSLLKEDNK
jgi:hypothetical protein